MNGLFCVLLLSFLGGVFDVQTDEMKSATEGDSITLDTPLTEILEDDTLLWMFGDEEAFIAQITRKAKLISLDVTDNERIKHRLQLDHQTGSLTIRNIRTTDSGLYKLKIISKETKYKRFHVLVDAVPDAGLSSGAVAGLIVGLLLVATVVGAGVLYHHYRISQLGRVHVSAVIGDTVTLHTDVTDIHRYDEYLWKFEDKTVATIKTRGKTTEESDTVDGLFRNKMKLNEQSGSLNIKDISTADSGVYTLKIKKNRETKCKKFIVNVSGEVESVSVTEGGAVTLNTGVTKMKRDEVIVWKFRDTLIAKINRESKIISTYDGPDGGFRDRLQLNHQTGSLTITNIRTTDTGLYKVQITSGETTYKRFDVTFKSEAERERNGDGRRGLEEIPLLSINSNHQPGPV